MAEDAMRAKARATFGKSFMDAAKPQPLAKNAATASQAVANKRPIPTYKVGGAVKKADGGVIPERIAARVKAGNYDRGGKVGAMKCKSGGSAKKRDGIPAESTSSMPTTSGGRSATMKDLEQANRDYGNMTEEERRAAGRAIGRGNATPYEPIPRKAAGGAAKVRKGMATQSGEIKQVVKPKKGIGGFM